MDTAKTYSTYLSKIQGKLDENLAAGLEFIKWKDLVKKDSKVFVKPNFTFPNHRRGVTTSPELLRGLLGILRNRCSSVFIGESDGGNHSFSAERAFDGHKIRGMCRELGVELVNLSKIPSEFVSGKIQNKKVKVQLPKMLLERVDCLISVPVLKVHVMTTVSLSIKNLWGCIPDTMRCLLHQNLDYKLALILKVLDPKIAIIDGLYALDGHGPMFGEAKKKDLLVASDNCVSADGLGASLIGVPPEKVGHLRIAEKEGLGITNLDRIEINTDWKNLKQEPFRTRRTIIDTMSYIPFKNDIAARLIFDSPLTRLVYFSANLIRSPEERRISQEIKGSGTT